MSSVVERLADLRLLPLVVLDDVSTAQPIGDALKAGGLPVAEVALRTPTALDAIRVMAQDPDMLVGAGTVTNPAQVAQAIDAGARYIVSPGFSPAVAAECRAVGISHFPGVATATEVLTALDAGIEVLKFFPAATSGGAAAIAALAGPYPDVRFVPTGGIDADSAAAYLRLPSVLAVGGSWMVTRQLVADRDFARITTLAAAATQLAGAGA